METPMDYQLVADTYAQKSEEMTTFLQSLPHHLSYPEKAQTTWQTFTGLDFSGDPPNHIFVPCPVHRQDFDQVDVLGKVLLTVKGRTVEGLTYSGNFRSYSPNN